MLLEGATGNEGEAGEGRADQVELQKYRSQFRIGLLRHEAATALRGKGVKFFDICCPSDTGRFSQLIKIGENPKPPFCSEYGVYISLDCAAKSSGEALRPRKDDVLKGIELRRWGTGCL